MRRHIETLKKLIGESTSPDSREALYLAIKKLDECYDHNTGREWMTCRGYVSVGILGAFGVRIQALENPNLNEGKANAWRGAINDAENMLVKVARQTLILADPQLKAEGEARTAELITCFDGPIYVEEIPNGYDPELVHHPWLVVTTTIGRFRIGWRKRVIEIDWSETRGTEEAQTLFTHEDVTKSGSMIHAWSVEKAKEYIAVIVASADSDLISSQQNDA